MEKSQTIKLNRLLAIVVQIYVIFGLILCKNFFSLKFLAGFSLVNTIIVMISVFTIGKRMFSVSSMFMLFLAVFHFGQAWLFAFSVEVDTTIAYDVFALYSHDAIYNILFFSILAYNLIALFWVLFSKEESLQNKIMFEEWEDKLVYERKIIFIFGLAFFFALLIPVLIYDYLSITITAEEGHMGLYDNAAELSTWAAANSYFPLAVIMVLMGCDSKKNGWKWMYYFAIGRCILLMVLTGKRGSFVIPLLLYIFCKHCFIKKYKRNHFLWIAVAVLLFLSMISFISYARSGHSGMDFFEYMQEKNIFVQILSEFGASFTTTILAYNYAHTFDFLDGRSFLGALSIFLPFSDHFASDVKQFMSVSALLNPFSPSKGALGGSLFGEMFINFGNFALFLTPVYAWCISKIENVIRNFNKYSVFTVCSSIYISYGFWLYVRGNLVDVVFILKRTVYVLILYLIFKLLFVRRSVINEKETVDRV